MQLESVNLDKGIVQSGIMLRVVRISFFEVCNLYLTALCSSTVLGFTAGEMATLQRDLLRDYNPLIRPVYNQSEAIQIGLSLSLMFIHGLNEREQELRVSAWIHMEWYDEFLRWNKSEYSGVFAVVLSPTDVWRPDITIANSLERMTKLAQGDYLARVKSDGLVEWSPGDMFKTHCTVDITYYPFDTQSCNITISSWMYVVNEVQLRALENVSLAHFEESGEWNIITSETHHVRKYYDCCPDEDTLAVTFILKLARRKTFYILTVIIPVLMFSFLNVVDFVLPPNSGEKMSLSVTVFLSFTLYMSLLNESMPRTSLTLSILGIYMIVVMGMGAVSVVLSSFVIMIHHAERPDFVHQWEPTIQRALSQIPNCLLSDIGWKLKYINKGSNNRSFIAEERVRKMPDDWNDFRAKRATVVTLASRCDRIFLWLSLAFSVIAATVVLVVLAYH